MAVRKLPRHYGWTWSVPGIIVVALLAAFFNPPDQAITQGDFDVVERVVDGDTLLMQSGERVRLIGVDTPETKHRASPCNTSARRRAPLPGGWWRESGFGWSLTKRTRHEGTKTVTGARWPMRFWKMARC